MKSTHILDIFEVISQFLHILICNLENVDYIMQYFDLRRQESGRSSVWLERYVRDVEVAGSNPVAPTIFFALKAQNSSFELFLFFLEKQHEACLSRRIAIKPELHSTAPLALFSNSPKIIGISSVSILSFSFFYFSACLVTNRRRGCYKYLSFIG